MNVRAIVAWTLYDFANSAFAAVIFATIYAAYYALGVVGNEGGAGDLWWGRVVSVSMGLVALTSPFLGGVADRAGIRRPLFIGFTAAGGGRHRAHDHGGARHDRLGLRAGRDRQLRLRERARLLQRLSAGPGPAEPSGPRVGLGLRGRLRGLDRGAAGRAALRARAQLRGRLPRDGRALRGLLAPRLLPAPGGSERPGAGAAGRARGRARRWWPPRAGSWPCRTCAASWAPTSSTRTA